MDEIDVDLAAERAQAELTELIRERRGAPERGAADCLRCGEPNDRAHLGYGACWGCTEAARG